MLGVFGFGLRNLIKFCQAQNYSAGGKKEVLGIALPTDQLAAAQQAIIEQLKKYA